MLTKSLRQQSPFTFPCLCLPSLTPPFFLFRLSIRLSLSFICVIPFSRTKTDSKNSRFGQHSISQTFTHTQPNKQIHDWKTYTNQFIIGIPNSFVVHRSLSTKVHKGANYTRHIYAGHTQTWLHISAGFAHITWLSIQTKVSIYLPMHLFHYGKRNFTMFHLFI